MGQSDDPKVDKPSWQVKVEVKEEPSKSETQSAKDSTNPSQQSTIVTARKFLEEDEVKNASRDAKVAFLEKKGLESDVIEELLGATPKSETAKTVQQRRTNTSAVPTPSPGSTSLTSRDSPPIITYPEFLTTPTQPAPLITAQRLLTTLYLFGGLSALIYGTSTYIVAPMVESLNESRHSLAETAQENLDKFVKKLEGVVSEVPPGPKVLLEDEDSDSDPTEMFHRDIGVQTSLPTTPRPQTPVQVGTLDDQTARLDILRGHIKDLNDSSTSEGQDTSELTTTVDVVREYLTSLAYVQPSYNYGIYGTAEKKDDNDKFAELKASIRQVKGALLSARSFPATRAK